MLSARSGTNNDVCQMIHQARYKKCSTKKAMKKVGRRGKTTASFQTGALKHL
jgi:hypothetical protein